MYVRAAFCTFTVASALHEAKPEQLASTGDCVYPGTCVAPPAEHSVVLPIKPRQQWNINGGFCGAMSVQVAAMGYGAWISQDMVRKANTHGEGHGSASVGYEVLPSNVAETARNLKLTYDEWDYNSAKPQVQAFKKWMKAHLVKSEPIVMFPICKGDSHTPYAGSTPNGGHFDHVEPIIGFGTNHALDDANVYDDDWLLHFSDQDLNTYYRHFNTLEDSTNMDGNCKNAGAGFGKNEMYPCLYDQVDYGLSVTGLNTSAPTLRVVLDVDHQSEPDVRMFQRAVEFHGTVTVYGLTAGKDYILYRYKGTAALPNSNFDSGYEYKTKFTAEGSTWTHNDPNSFMSNGATYYVAVPAGESVVV